MIVISDTTAITNLLAIGKEELLAKLFGEISIASAVAQELSAVHESLPEFILTSKILVSTSDAALLTLHVGERESILLAEHVRAAILIMDERKGRRIAQERGIRCVGLLGVLVEAKRRNLISSVQRVLGDLESKANFFVSDELRNEVLNLAGE